MEQYKTPNKEAFYKNRNGEKRMHSVHYGAYNRFNKAKKQIERDPVDIKDIIKYVNEVLEDAGIPKVIEPKLDLEGKIENDIHKKIEDKKIYKKIKETKQLEDEKEIIWLKFTKDGYLGVVARTNDINFQIPRNEEDYDRGKYVYNEIKKKEEWEWEFNTSGILLHKLKKSWDESFVLVFPLRKLKESKYTSGEIECAIGNYLIYKGVPIIDYYSHNN